MSEFDSKEEQHFQWYIDELVEAGYIRKFKYQPKPFKLFDGQEMRWLEIKKTKTVERHSKLLSGHTYQADFIIYWNSNAELKFFASHERVLNQNFKKFPFIANHHDSIGYYSVVDVKGNYNQNDAWRRFSIDQKWVFQQHGIYVQKIICAPAGTKKFTPAYALFMTSFAPKRFLLTDESMKPRKIHFPYRLLKDL